MTERKLDQSIAVHFCPECDGRTWANSQPICFDCLLMEGRTVRLEPRTYVPAPAYSPTFESEKPDA